MLDELRFEVEQMHVLAIDVGTSAVKAAVLDAAAAGPIGPIAKQPYDYDRPTPDAAELPADRLWFAVAAAARTAAAGQRVEGVGLSCLMPALIVLDAADRPLAPVRLHNDRRPRAIARRIEDEVGREFLADVGIRPLPGGCSVTSWRHLAESDPGLVGRVAHYLHANGWLALRMTGERAFDPANASFTGLFHTTTRRTWSPRWCERFGVDPAWLPPVVCGSTTLGRLRPEAAAELGVPAGVPVKIGTADTSSAILAAEMRPGDLLHTVGTTQVLAGLTDDPTPDPRRLTRLFGVGTSYVRVTHNPVGGAALEWLHRLCFRDLSAEEFYGPVIDRAIDRSTDVRLDPPYLGGDRLRIDAVTANFSGLSLATDRLDLLTALLHGIRDRHEESVDGLGLGRNFRRVIITGGGADVIRRLIPQYRERALEPLDEGALRGVARLFVPAPLE